MNTTAPTMTPEVAAVLAVVARRGITLQAAPGPNGARLRFHPRSAMTPDLAERIRTHKPALLELLGTGQAGQPDHATDPTHAPIGPDGAESEVSSVSEPLWGLWGEDELALLSKAGTTPEDMPLVSALKDTFADDGLTVVSVESKYRRGGWTRRQAARLIIDARRSDRALAAAMRDAWAERMAICTVEGGMSEYQAERFSLAALENMLYL